MDSPKKQNPEAADSRDKRLSDEELKNVTGGTQSGDGEQQVNIGDLPNVRVDVTPM